jgi:hypothetical protein
MQKEKMGKEDQVGGRRWSPKGEGSLGAFES